MKWLTAVAASALLLVAAPALAHEEISPANITTGKPTFFTLSAANEKTVDLASVTVDAPSGVAFGAATRTPAGWKLESKTDNQVVWSGGVVKPDDFESWGYEIEGADQPGDLTYKVELGYADGSKSEAIDVVVKAAAPASGKGGATKNRRANLAIALAALAVVLSVAALVVGRRGTAPAKAGENW